MIAPAKPGAKHEQPPLELKHMIWILEWAKGACADRIKEMELDVVRHSAFAGTPACTQYDYKDRAQEQMALADRITEYRAIYAWLHGAKLQAMTKSHEEFARDMAEYVRQNFGRKK